MSDTNKATASPEAPATAPATGGPVDLTVQDLNTIRTVIDIATQRGAFKANELQATPEGVPATAQPISGADAAAAMSGEVPATATMEKK